MGCQSACYEWADSYDSKVRQALVFPDLKKKESCD